MGYSILEKALNGALDKLSKEDTEKEKKYIAITNYINFLNGSGIDADTPLFEKVKSIMLFTGETIYKEREYYSYNEDKEGFVGLLYRARAKFKFNK